MKTFFKDFRLQELDDQSGVSFERAERIKLFVDGKYVNTDTELTPVQDVKAEAYTNSGMRLADLSAGMAFSLPANEPEIDYTIARFRTQVKFANTVLTVSDERSNPYCGGEFLRDDPWYVYGGEWLIAHINNDEFFEKNGLIRLNGTKAYPFGEGRAYGDLTVKEGYDVYRYDVKICDEEGIRFPYYNIAILRELNDAQTFALFVMKSDADQKETMDFIVKSFRRFSPYGVKKNYLRVSPKGNARWNEATKNYYDALCHARNVQWGVFSYSMPGPEEQLVPGNAVYDEYAEKSKKMQAEIEKAWNHKFDIYPTYTHISSRGVAHHFPSAMALELAGGDGVNGKPVLQFTYQFTTNNNIVGDEVTPMFDILRGVYDEQFRRLARDIKAYRAPVLFRLNNEMNTDWTSYCGMVTLLDPDIFVMTWQRLYDIFEEEGVDNAIWIWNPIATSCPYSSWGEDLSYFPGVEYVQLLGGTSYEMNNYDADAAAEKVITFRTHYQNLYEKNAPAFPGWNMILSEFACGSGGDCSGELGRNAAVQAKWVREMFSDFKAGEDWILPIKGAIWFNCNDKVGDKTSNRLRFIDPDGGFEDLKETVEAFRSGFASQIK